MIINNKPDMEFERMGAMSRLERRLDISGLDDYGQTSGSGDKSGFADDRYESENIDDLQSYLMSTNAKVDKDDFGVSSGRKTPRNGLRNDMTKQMSTARQSQSDVLCVNYTGEQTRRRRSRELIESQLNPLNERGRPVGRSTDVDISGWDLKNQSQDETGMMQRPGYTQDRRNSTDSNAESTTSSNKSSRPKSAYHSRFRRPRNMSNSDCDSDIETIPLDDSGSPVFEEEFELPKQQATKSSNSGPQGYDVRNSTSGWFDSAPGNHGNGLNRRKVEAGFQIDKSSRSQKASQWQQSEKVDSFDSVSFDDEIDSDSNVQGILRIKRKHLRRRFLSEHDSEWDSNSTTSSDPSDRSSPTSLGTQGTNNNNLLNLTQTYQNPGEKVLEKYKRRASGPVYPSMSETSVISQGSGGFETLGSTKSHPSVPRKLRPLFPKAGNPLQEVEGGGSYRQNQERQPLPLDMRTEDTCTHDHGVTLSPAEVRQSMDRLKSHMAKHLNEEQLQQLELAEDDGKHLSNPSLSSHKGRFVPPERKQIESETSQQDGVLSMLTQPQSVQRNRAKRGELRPIRPQQSRTRRERAPETYSTESNSNQSEYEEMIKKSPSPRTLAPISKRKNSDPDPKRSQTQPVLGLGSRQKTILDINLKDKENKQAGTSDKVVSKQHLVPEKQPLGRTCSDPESGLYQMPRSTRSDSEVTDMMADLNWCKSSQSDRDPFA